MDNDFCVFIISYARAARCLTYDLLKKKNYQGRVFVVIDDKDPQQDEYEQRFKDELLVFSKDEVGATIDLGDNFEGQRSDVFVRNACFTLAKQVGCTYFIQLDDDYTTLGYRFNKKGQYGWWPVQNIDNLFETLLKYYKAIPALSLCISQGGDHIGGGLSQMGKAIISKRKAMNSWMCSTERPFEFVGRINDDVNTVVMYSRKGGLFLTIGMVMLTQLATQSNPGGMTEVFLDSGTYVKSFYSVMYQPSCVKIGMIGPKNYRIHHAVQWRNATPCIIHDRHKKP
jgi:hypothetical protein